MILLGQARILQRLFAASHQDTIQIVRWSGSSHAHRQRHPQDPITAADLEVSACSGVSTSVAATEIANQSDGISQGAAKRVHRCPCNADGKRKSHFHRPCTGIGGHRLTIKQFSRGQSTPFNILPSFCVFLTVSFVERPAETERLKEPGCSIKNRATSNRVIGIQRLLPFTPKWWR